LVEKWAVDTRYDVLKVAKVFGILKAMNHKAAAL
jgi:hypothetical protein